MSRRKTTESHEPARAQTDRPATTPPVARDERAARDARDARAAGNQAVQANLKVGQRGNRAEQEAEGAARQVSQGATAPPATRARDEGTPSAAPPSVARTLAEPGRALPKPLRQEMEGAFARDFSQVRVHSDASARESATAINARAYTHGNDIVLGDGVPSMSSPAGRHLLAHELTHVTQQHEGVIHRQTIESQMPKELDVVSVSVSLTIPGGKQLTDNWNDLSTTDSTRVELSLLRTSLTVSFYPPLLIDMQWPLSDLEWSSAVYDFATGSVTSVGLYDSQTLAAGRFSEARTNITDSITATLKGSRAAAAGYDPMTDPNPGETLQKIKTNIIAAPSSGSEVGAADVTNVSSTADVSFKSEIRQGDQHGMVVIPAGGSARITADLTGSLAGISAHPQVSAVHIESNDIKVQTDGADIVKLTRLTVHRGGNVTVEAFEPLGAAATASGAEAGLNLLIAGLILASGTPADRPALAGRDLHLEPTLVPGVIRKELEDALTKAVMGLLQAQARALPPGVDLNELFGIATPPIGPGDFNPPPTGGNAYA